MWADPVKEEDDSSEDSSEEESSEEESSEDEAPTKQNEQEMTREQRRAAAKVAPPRSRHGWRLVPWRFRKPILALLLLLLLRI